MLRELPPTLRRTLTWDQGTEMAKHLDVTADTGTKIHFCDAAIPWCTGHAASQLPGRTRHELAPGSSARAALAEPFNNVRPGRPQGSARR